MVRIRFTNRLSKGERGMEHDLSSLRLLADTAALVSKGKLSLTPSIFAHDDDEEVTVATTAFGPNGVGGFVKDSDRRLHTFDSTEARETGRIPEKTKETGLAALIGPSELPIDYMAIIREMRGRDVTLVVEKKLTATDMSRGQSRLSIPKKQIRKDFLRKEEIQILDRKEGIKVSLIEPCLKVSHGLQLRKWSYMSNNFSYVLTERWNAVTHPYDRNELITNVVIQLWSFRVDGNLCFCLVKVKTPESGKYSYS